MELGGRHELNKFENSRTKLSESKVRGQKWILAIFRGFNLHFSQKIKLILLRPKIQQVHDSPKIQQIHDSRKKKLSIIPKI